jgi:hypothetical protein
VRSAGTRVVGARAPVAPPRLRQSLSPGKEKPAPSLMPGGGRRALTTRGGVGGARWLLSPGSKPSSAQAASSPSRCTAPSGALARAAASSPAARDSSLCAASRSCLVRCRMRPTACHSSLRSARRQWAAADSRASAASLPYRRAGGGGGASVASCCRRALGALPASGAPHAHPPPRRICSPNLRPVARHRRAARARGYPAAAGSPAPSPRRARPPRSAPPRTALAPPVMRESCASSDAPSAARSLSAASGSSSTGRPAEWQTKSSSWGRQDGGCRAGACASAGVRVCQRGCVRVCRPGP